MHPVHERSAPAKINLSLHVTGRRADGYHLLDALTAFCTLADGITVRAGGPRDRVVMSGPFADRVDGPNLASRAVTAFRARFGFAPGVDIRIAKRIPVAAGLGGGSSDAAAVLRAMQALAPSSPDDGALRAVALTLGADVPACLDGIPVRMRGIGQCLTPIGQLPALPLVLVNPGVALPTPDVFARRRGPYAPGRRIPARAWTAEELFDHLGRSGHNDLTDAACAIAPVVGETLDALAARTDVRCYGMSGSGATCFGLMAPGGDEAAAEASRCFTGRGWWSAACRLLPGAPR